MPGIDGRKGMGDINPITTQFTSYVDYHRRNSGSESSGTDPIITGGITRRTASPPDQQHTPHRQGTGSSIQIPPQAHHVFPVAHV